MKTSETIKNILFHVPKRLKKNWVKFTPEQMKELEKSITENYHAWVTPDMDESYKKAVHEDLLDHLYRRLDGDRRRVIPWLDSIRPLEDSTILEIGCGTGSSTLAFREQRSFIFGIDVDSGALKVAEVRFKLAKQYIALENINATKIKKTLFQIRYDFIVYYASLEHMTIEERISSLRQAWEMLSPGSYLVIVETPNRLWHYDSHTSELPFFNWLPDELAFIYSKYSPKTKFNDSFRELEKETIYTPSACEKEFTFSYDKIERYKASLDFQRRGRGVSYHEFEIALGKPVNELNVVSSLGEFELINRLSPAERLYMKLLRKQKPGLSKGWFYPYLNIAIKK